MTLSNSSPHWFFGQVVPPYRVSMFKTSLLHLRRKAFTAGLFDATTTSNLGSFFGQTKVRLEVRSASPEQYEGDFNAEKEWHKHMPTPWDVMQLNPAQALTISCQSCGVQISSSDLRDTYGRSFVVKNLDKIHHDCSNLFPQDSKRINLPSPSRALLCSSVAGTTGGMWH